MAAGQIAARQEFENDLQKNLKPDKINTISRNYNFWYRRTKINTMKFYSPVDDALALFDPSPGPPLLCSGQYRVGTERHAYRCMLSLAGPSSQFTAAALSLCFKAAKDL